MWNNKKIPNEKCCKKFEHHLSAKFCDLTLVSVHSKNDNIDEDEKKGVYVWI